MSFQVNLSHLLKLSDKLKYYTYSGSFFSSFQSLASRVGYVAHRRGLFLKTMVLLSQISELTMQISSCYGQRLNSVFGKPFIICNNLGKTNPVVLVDRKGLG